MLQIISFELIAILILFPFAMDNKGENQAKTITFILGIVFLVITLFQGAPMYE